MENQMGENMEHEMESEHIGTFRLQGLVCLSSG